MDDLDVILEVIKKQFINSEFNLLKQGEKYRKLKSKEEKKKVAKDVVKSIKRKTDDDDYKRKISETIKSIPIVHSTSREDKEEVHTPKEKLIDTHEHEFTHDNQKYLIKIKIVHDIGMKDLYTLLDGDYEGDVRVATSRVNLEHEFCRTYNILGNKESIEPIITIIKGLILSEIISMAQGTTLGGNIRKNLNVVLKTM